MVKCAPDKRERVVRFYPGLCGCSSVVERSAHNGWVAGSIPSSRSPRSSWEELRFAKPVVVGSSPAEDLGVWPSGMALVSKTKGAGSIPAIPGSPRLVVRTTLFHGVNAGSIPAGSTCLRKQMFG